MCNTQSQTFGDVRCHHCLHSSDLCLPFVTKCASVWLSEWLVLLWHKLNVVYEVNQVDSCLINRYFYLCCHLMNTHWLLTPTVPSLLVFVVRFFLHNWHVVSEIVFIATLLVIWPPHFSLGFHVIVSLYGNADLSQFWLPLCLFVCFWHNGLKKSLREFLSW